MLACSWDVELALKEEDGGSSGVFGLNSDVVKEGGSEPWNIESEYGFPFFSNGTSGLGAGTGVVTLTCAVVDSVVSNGTSELALEGDGLEVNVWDVPDAANVEHLCALGANGFWHGCGVLGQKDKVLLSRHLGNNNAVILVLLLFGVVNSLGFNH